MESSSVSRRGTLKLLGALTGGVGAGMVSGSLSPVAALNDPDKTYGLLFGKLISPKNYPDLYKFESKGDTEISHFNGVTWHDAPVPPKGHTCFIQTDGWIGFTQVQRCACGAIRGFDGVWAEVNSR